MRRRTILLLPTRRIINLPLLLHILGKLIMNLIRAPGHSRRIKHRINLLKRSPRCLGVRQEDMDGHDGAEDGEDDVGAPLDVCESWRDEVCECEVEGPVCCACEADAFRAVL